LVGISLGKDNWTQRPIWYAMQVDKKTKEGREVWKGVGLFLLTRNTKSTMMRRRHGNSPFGTYIDVVL
jgi:hypothetical protein